MHEKNAFITLTYDDAHLPGPKLVYSDWQKFMKRLRKTQAAPIGCFVTGEYGDENKRPHWHAILFNYWPKDSVFKRNTRRGDRVFSSVHLDSLWGNGISEFGFVTFESAGYCARYAAKKLVHGQDLSHDYNPISRKSSKHAIGKKFLEKFWADVFHTGYVLHPDGVQKLPIPRYYERWLKQEHPAAWLSYVTGPKVEKTERAYARSEKEELAYRLANIKRLGNGMLNWTVSPTERRRLVLEAKFKRLQQFNKL